MSTGRRVTPPGPWEMVKVRLGRTRGGAAYLILADDDVLIPMSEIKCHCGPIARDSLDAWVERHLGPAPAEPIGEQVSWTELGLHRRGAEGAEES